MKRNSKRINKKKLPKKLNQLTKMILKVKERCTSKNSNQDILSLNFSGKFVGIKDEDTYKNYVF
jgi:hypothetical protein